jgi:ABC-type phosphate transport system substrate-binding protein
LNATVGDIRYWNDARILADNSGVVKAILKTIVDPITVAVRVDGSGTTNIFTTALTAFDPITTGLQSDYSFANTVGLGEKPSWCSKLTDEVQIIKVTGCGVNNAVQVNLTIVGYDYILRDMSFDCDMTATEFQGLWQSANGGKAVHVKKTVTSTTVQFLIGYLASADFSNKPTNWYQPAIISYASGLTVTVSTLQEGGYLNSHYNYASKPVSVEIKSLWIDTSASSPFTFTLSYGGLTNSTSVLSSSSITANQVLNTLLSLAPAAIASVVLKTRSPSTWVEFLITYKSQSSSSWTAPVLAITQLSDPNAIDSIAITTLQTHNNFPIFYDSSSPGGFGISGKYTCYKRQQNYTAFAYRTGSGNPGVIAEVVATPNSIGYSVLGDAIQNSIPSASMINRAGKIIEATADTVAFAVLESGGNLDAYNNAILVDGSSYNAWPISGYTYFILRTSTTRWSCARRQSAMDFLYNFYHSDTVQSIAKRHGFASLPSFIRDIVVNKLVNSVLCADGSYAMEKYRTSSIPIFATNLISSVMKIYLTVYNQVDAESSFSLTTDDLSTNFWTSYVSSPEDYAGAFTVFGSTASKLAAYNQGAGSIITSAFNHFSVVAIYHLNAYPSASALYLTSEILAGIFTGQIIYWNDTLIQKANVATKSNLPYKRITVVTSTDPSDTNLIFSRFLAMKSAVYQSAHDVSIDGAYSTNYSRVLSNELYHIDRADSTSVDSAVTHYDGSIGYYNLMYGVPNAFIARYCHDADCLYPVDPNDNGVSLNACQLDSNTAINPSDSLSTYDLMLSTSKDCYPIAGTIDFSTYSVANAATCVSNSSFTAAKTKSRIKFASWLYNGSVVTQPLGNYQASSSLSSARLATYTNLCDITCASTALGYEYCNYRDCSYSDGDFYQQVSTCKDATSTREVSYNLLPERGCLDISTPSSVSISCAYVTSGSSAGITGYFLSALGVTVCLVFLVAIYLYRKLAIIRKSQPIFIYLFILGGICMNMTIIVYIGSNTDVTCMLRPVFFNLSSTLMFAPLVLKLRRVNVLFNNPSLKKIVITDRHVIVQILSLLSMDVILLIAWYFAETPRVITIETTKYANLYEPVSDRICSTGFHNYFEIIFICYKSLLVIYGVYQAVIAWNVPSDFSEAKYFAVAIYNITMIGGLAYFLSAYLADTTGIFAAIILRSLGLFSCSVVAVTVIVFPKLYTNDSAAIAPDSSTGSQGTYSSKKAVVNADSMNVSRGSLALSVAPAQVLCTRRSMIGAESMRAERGSKNLESEVASPTRILLPSVKLAKKGSSTGLKSKRIIHGCSSNDIGSLVNNQAFGFAESAVLSDDSLESAGVLPRKADSLVLGNQQAALASAQQLQEDLEGEMESVK